MSAQQASEIDIYARVSRAGDDRQRSVKGQVDDCLARLAERGLTPGVVHVDNSRSAWNPRVHRPGWDTQMARLESGAAGGVIVFDLARLSRRPIEGERLIEAAERGLLILDSEGEYDLTSASGKKGFRDQLAGAAYESDRLSTRVRRGKRARALQSESNHSTRPFGFEPDGVTVREDEAAILREVVERFLAGESLNRLWRDLNARGVTTSTGREWDRTTLRRVLERPRNAGLLTYRGQIVGRLQRDGEPVTPIIGEQRHEQVTAKLAARRRGRPPSDAYLCSGVAVCGRCGSHLNGRPRTGHFHPDGAVRRVYWCQTGTEGCGGITIDQRALDAHVKALTIAVLSDARHAAAIEAAAAERADRAERLDSVIAELEEVALQIGARLGRGEITLERHDAITGPLEPRLARLRAEREAVPDEPAVVDPVASRAEWERRWSSATVEERRSMLRMALRGHRLVIAPAVRSNRGDIAGRVTVEG